MAIKAVLQSIKLYGALIALAIIGAFVWGLVQYELLDTSKWSNLGWIASISMGLIIWLGLNAYIMWKKATGVYTTDVTDEE
jgi:cytochrome b561